MLNWAIPILVLSGLMCIVSGALFWANRRFPRVTEPLIDAVDAVLPQTQCAQCGYPGCRPYAAAVVTGNAALDLCPPGGPAVELELRTIMGTTATSTVPTPVAELAQIDETACIGCALCLPACPVDAIVGANGFMHTVIESECTGCELCISPCPVDCIVMVDPA